MDEVGTRPLIESGRLERVVALARIAGAALALLIGPLFPNTGATHIFVLAGVLVAWSVVFAAILRRAPDAAAAERAARLGLLLDIAIVIYAMWIFSPDPGWTTWAVAPVLIIPTGFRFGRPGAVLSALAFSFAYLAISVWREGAYGYPLEWSRAAFHVILYLLEAFVLSSSLRELFALRVERERRMTHDALTGLPNRTRLVSELERAIEAEREGAGSTSVLVLDLVDFRSINEDLGDRVGDAVLRTVGTRLQPALRPGDVLARLRSDEFGVLLRGADAPTAQRESARMLRQLEEPVVVEAQALHIGWRAGVASSPEHARDAESLLGRAEAAMNAPDSGAGMLLVPRERRSRPRARLAELEELRRAIANGELVLDYQPIARLADGEVAALEALVRWEHPTRGRLLPDAFISAAERTPLIVPLTAHVIELAVRQTRRWLDAGLPLSVSVNLSRRSLADRDLVGTVAAALDRWGLPAARLRLEVTETMLLNEPERALETCAELRAVGVTLSIDDFGSGYSSLIYLDRLPLSEVKIDRTFVRDLAMGGGSPIVKATVELSHALGLEVVAEGVESAAALGRLRDLGCDNAQGYFIARPMAAEDVAPWASRRRAALAPLQPAD